MLTSYNGTAITYDAIGNPLKWRNATAIEWQGRNLTMFSNSNGEIYNYAYNADGIRTQKNVFNANGDFAGSTEYIYDGTKLIAESRNGDWLYYFYDANGTVTGMYYNNVLYYFRKNLQGDITGIYNASGNIIAQYEYTPYGAILSITDANGVDISTNATHVANINPFRYKGYYYDTDTGFYYLITRYYDPVVGRFLNADAFASTGQGILGNNMFAYCGNNPINCIDRTGRLWETILEETLKSLAQQLEVLAEYMAKYSSIKITKHNAHMYASTARGLYKAICSKAYLVKASAELSTMVAKYVKKAGIALDIISNFFNDELSFRRKITDTAVDLGLSFGVGYLGAKIGTFICPGAGTAVGAVLAIAGEYVIENTQVDEWIKDGVDYVMDGVVSAGEWIADGVVSAGEWIADGVVSAGEWIADGVSSVMDTFCGWFGW